MPTTILPYTTDAGLSAAVNAAGNGLQLAITHVVLSKDKFTPGGSSTLTNRQEKTTIAAAAPIGVGAFRVNVLFPGYASAPYDVTAIGFYAGDPDAGGVLFAVHSHPTDVIVERNNLDYLAQFAVTLARVPLGSVTVSVDPSLPAALALVAAHESLIDPHPQYVRNLAAGAALPSVDEGTIWHPDFNSLMTWQSFTSNGANYTGYASVDIGLIRLDTQQVPRGGRVKIGVSGLPTSLALYHWAKHNGLMLTSGWSAGTLFYRDFGNGTFGTPDVRGEHPRFWDDLRGVVPSQAFGAWLQDAFQGHNHAFKNGPAEGDAGDVTTNGNGHAWEIATPWVTEMGGYGAPRIATETRGRSTAFAGSIQI